VHVTNPAVVVDAARVVVPHTKRLAPQVLWALQKAEVDFELVDVSGSDEAYFELFSELWREQKPFTIVEHDIVDHGGAVKAFDRCEREWCAAAYPYLRSTYWGLGCTRFRSSLMERFPDLPDEVAAYDAPKHFPKHWCTLDQAVTACLRAQRVEWPHLHGEVQHLGDNLPAHGCRS
jgi:hypothetical protein